MDFTRTKISTKLARIFRLKITQRNWLVFFILLVMPGYAQSAANYNLSVGTINYSSHYISLEEEEQLNETHNGLYVQYQEWMVGAFTNSYDDSSRFVTRRFNLDQNFSVEVGVADGYEKANDHGYMPLAGLTYHYSIVNISLTPIFVLVGLEFQIGD